MTLPAWDQTDRLIDPAFVNNEWPRYTDYVQLRNGLLAVKAWFEANHSGATGIHSTTYAVGDFTGDNDTGSSTTQSGTISTSASNGGIVWAGATWRSPNDNAHSNALSVLSRAANGASSGKIEILNGLVGYDATSSGVTSCVGSRRLTTTGTNAGLSYQVFHTPTYSPEVIGPQHSDYISGAGGTLEGPYTWPWEQRSNRARFRTRDVYNGNYGRAVTKSMYRQMWRLCYALYNAIKYEHGATGTSFGPSALRLYGRQLMASADLSSGESFSVSKQFTVGEHGGDYQYLFPYIRLMLNSTSVVPGTLRWLINPAFDDTNAYIDVQPVGSAINPDTAWQWSAGAAMCPDSLPSSGTTSPIDTTLLATQGHAIRNSEWLALFNGLQAYKDLYSVEHDFPTGGHRYPIQRIKGANKVFDSTVSVPSAISNVAYTAASTTTGSSPSSSYTDVTVTQIDTLQAGGGKVYIPSLVGHAGSGIATASIAVDDGHVYLVTRRKTSGTTNTFGARVWRLDHA